MPIDQQPAADPGKRTLAELWRTLPVELQMEIWRCAVSYPQVHRITLSWLHETRLPRVLPFHSLKESTQQYRSIASTCRQAQDTVRRYMPDIIRLWPGGVLRFHGTRDLICIVGYLIGLLPYGIPRMMEALLSSASICHLGMWVTGSAHWNSSDFAAVSTAQAFLGYKTVKTMSIVFSASDDRLMKAIFSGKLRADETQSSKDFDSSSDNKTVDDDYQPHEDEEKEDEEDEGRSAGEKWRADMWRVHPHIPPGEDWKDCLIKSPVDAMWWRVYHDTELQEATPESAWTHLLGLTAKWNSEILARGMSKSPKRCTDCRKPEGFCHCWV